MALAIISLYRFIQRVQPFICQKDKKRRKTFQRSLLIKKDQ